MQITTNRGKTFDVTFIGALNRFAYRVLIEMKDDIPLADLAADFDGLTTITKTDADRPGVKEVFEGFTRLTGMQHNKQAGTIRLTLEKDDAV